MAKKFLPTPYAVALPDSEGTSAAESDFVVLTPTMASFDVEDSAEEVDFTTAENEGYMTYEPGLVDFTATLNFKGNDSARAYTQLSEWRRNKTAIRVWLAESKNAAISAENVGWRFIAKIFTLSRSVGPGDGALTVALRPGGAGGVVDVTTPETFANGYSNLPVPKASS